MAQNVNPLIFRLGKTKNWESEYFEKKSTETSILPYQDLEIKNFIKQFLKTNGLMVHQCKLLYSTNGYLHIFVSYYLTTKSVFLIHKITKKQRILTIKQKHKKNFRKFTTKKNKKNFLEINFKNKQNKRSILKKNFNKKFLKKIINTNSIKKNVINYIKYQQINYKKRLKKSIQKIMFKKVKSILNYEKQFLKVRRFKQLKLYKKYLTIKNKKTVKNIQTQLFIEKIFKSLYFFLNQKTKIVLTFQQLNQNIKYYLNTKKIERIKKLIVSLRRYTENRFFKDGINILFLSTLHKNSGNLLAQYISTELPKLKRHHFFLNFLKKIFNILIKKKIVPLTRIKMKIKGRFNGAPRAKCRTITLGNRIPVQKLKSNIEYAESTAYTSNGTFGIKIWLFRE